MSFEVHRNFAFSTVAVAPSPATSGLTLTVASGHGGRFSSTMKVVVCPAGTAPDSGNAEVTDIASIAGDVLTLGTRGLDGSSARAIVAGDQIFAPILASYLAALEAALGASATGIIPVLTADPGSPVDNTGWILITAEGGGVESATLKVRRSGVTKSIPWGDLS